MHACRSTLEDPTELRRKFADEDEADAEPDEPTDDEPATGETAGDDGGLGSLLEFGGLDDTEQADRDRAGTEPATPDRPDGEDVAAEIAALREAVERQGERLEEQQALLERLIEELRRAGGS